MNTLKKINTTLLGLVLAATVAATGCTTDYDDYDDTEDSTLANDGSGDNFEPHDNEHCVAACRSMLGACYEDLDITVLNGCRQDCTVGGLAGFDIECLAELPCGQDANDCIIEDEVQ